MAEYIKRTDALRIIDEVYGAGKVYHRVRNIPAADVAPVRHGRWLKQYRSGIIVGKGCVSSCCDMWNERKSNYCPNCGALMDGEKDDG